MAKILVVEDEMIISEDIQGSLTRLGYEVCGSATTGEKAIKLAEDLSPDLILMDIMLKGELSGIEAAEIIREEYNIPIVFLTAYADDSTLSKAKITMPSGYILKPFKEIDLRSTIEIALFNHQKQKDQNKELDLLYTLAEGKNSRNFIFVKSNSQLVKINTKDIYFVEALKDYVVINTLDSKYTIHSTMKDIDSKLGDADFIRVHRSYIVRIDKIALIDYPNLQLEDGKKLIPIGGSYREGLMNKLNLI
ncbi:MAG: response regulator [Brumimicrobium sp.]